MACLGWSQVSFLAAMRHYFLVFHIFSSNFCSFLYGFFIIEPYRTACYAKNTSEKVRRVMQSRGSAGIPLTTNPPFGYKKSSEDKNRWIIRPCRSARKGRRSHPDGEIPLQVAEGGALLFVSLSPPCGRSGGDRSSPPLPGRTAA